jgi:hypothetical protein
MAKAASKPALKGAATVPTWPVVVLAGPGPATTYDRASASIAPEKMPQASRAPLTSKNAGVSIPSMTAADATTDSKSFADAYIALSLEAQNTKSAAIQQVLDFCRKVQEYDNQPASRQFRIGNRLRKISGRPGRRMVTRLDGSVRNLHRTDIDDLLKDKHTVKGLESRQHAQEISGSLPCERAAQLAMGAFEKNLIKGPALLYSVLVAWRSDPSKSNRYQEIWADVLKCPGPWTPFDEFTAACKTFAAQLEPDTAGDNAGLTSNGKVTEPANPNLGASTAEREAQTNAKSLGQSEKTYPLPTHSIDFTHCVWFGQTYDFHIGHQAKALGLLWAEWEKNEGGLHEKTIGKQIDSASENFRLVHVFSKHKAWGTMITKSAGRGQYKLAPPKTTE